MTGTCPNCGKPVRAGARFCGSCGTSMQEAEPVPSSKVEQSTCPHCGKPVRADAKFCPSCGQSIPAAAVAAAAAFSSEDAEAGAGESPPPSEPGDTAPATAPMERSFFSRYWWLIILLVVLCVVIIPGGWIFATDPFEWRSAETPTPTATNVEVSTETEVVESTEETETATVEPTETLTATSTESPTATESLATESPTPDITEETPESATATSTTEILLEEDFEGDLDEQWLIWGEPPPTTTGPNTNKGLDLSGDPHAAGITSKEIIEIEPTLEIIFDAALKAVTPNDLLTFDWDQGTEERQAADPGGFIQILLGDELAQMIVIQENPLCQTPLRDTISHNYLVRIEEGITVSFFMDGEEICTLDIPRQREVAGRVSFSGSGYVDNVLISRSR